jgi:hypothetical protein
MGRDHRVWSVLVDTDVTIDDDDPDDDDGNCDCAVGVDSLDALSRAGRECSRDTAATLSASEDDHGGGEGEETRGA